MIKNFKIGCLFAMVWIHIGCDKQEMLTLERIEFNNEYFQIGGYYFSSDINRYNVYLLYQNGVMYYVGSFAKNKTRAEIEEKVKMPDVGTIPYKRTRNSWGVFQIRSDSIFIEYYGDVVFDQTIFETGLVINDTTFLINNRKGFQSGFLKTNFNIMDTFRFVQFNEKPDSTNNFIK